MDQTFLEKVVLNLSDSSVYLRSNNEPIFNNFTCEYIAPSTEKPTSVHKLRPGDINVVAALGDSLTAGNGAGASNVVEVLLNYRGLAFSIGGFYEERDNSADHNDNVFEHFTVPNALKFYNPDLKGFATGIGEPGSENAHLDMAVLGSTAINLTTQAHLLIQKLKNDPSYDFDHDWKLLTILIGGNDICFYCSDEEGLPENFMGLVREALDYLHDTVPRIMVNMMTLFNIDVMVTLGKSIYLFSTR